MVQADEVTRQLKRIKADFHLWGKGEARELPRILLPGEIIQQAIMGRYTGGFAMLCATDQRLLLIDKKPFYLTIEDIRYDMLSELDYRHQLLDATLHIQTINKQLRFTSWDRKRMEQVSAYVQQRVSELRQHGATPDDDGAPEATPQNDFAAQTTMPPEPSPPVQQLNVHLAPPQPAPPTNDQAKPAPHPQNKPALTAWWHPTLGEYAVATQLEPTSRDNPPSQFVPSLWQPLGRRRNPYASTPLMIRRRVSRSFPGGR